MIRHQIIREDIRRLGVPNGSGGIEVDAREWERISNLAIAGYIAQPYIADLNRKIDRLESLLDGMRFRIRQLIENKDGFLQACRDAPLRLREALLSIHGKERGPKDRQRG